MVNVKVRDCSKNKTSRHYKVVYFCLESTGCMGMVNIF